MDKNWFTYYHVVKNEDATPFCHLWEKGRGFIVAADGLGGSGSTVHRLSDDQYAKLADTLPGLILPEYYDENITFMTAVREEEAIRDMTPDGDIDTDQIAGVIVDTIKEALPESDSGETAEEIAEEVAEASLETGERVDEMPSASYAKKMDTSFDQWLCELFDSMIDDIPDTSALWGSRIAISRYVFYMLSNPDTDLSGKEDREKITAFIYKGMQAVADHYSLSAGSISGQSVLPTTFVSMRFKTEVDGRILVEAIWAGDSRAYAFIPGQGMKQLSVDDEDESGSICNLFTLGRSNTPFATNLHYAAYRLPAKSAIFVCSDGVFDPYAPIDNIGVEAMFLEALQQATDFEGLGNAWHNLYSPMRHDDTSVAFKAFGFENFDEFKACFLPAYDSILKAYEGYHLGKKIYPIIMGEEEHPQVYIEERAARRMEQIARALAANILDPDAPSDVTVTAHLRQAYDILRRTKRCNEIRAFLDDSPAKAEEVFLYPDADARDVTAVAIRTLIDGARSIMDATTLPKKVNKKLDEIIRKGDALAAAIDQRSREVGQLMLKCIEGVQIIDAVGKGLQDFYDPQTYNEYLDRNVDAMNRFFTNRASTCTRAQQALETVREYWDDRASMDELHARATDPGRKPNDNGIKYLVFFETDLHFFEEMRQIINEYLELKNQQKDYADDYQQKQDERYVKLVSDMDNAVLAAILSESAHYLTDTAQALFSSEAVIFQDELTTAFVNLFQNKPEYFSEVIASLSSSDTPTILDSIFNAGRLKVARTFNSFDKDAVLENRKAVDVMLTNYEDVKAWSVV